MAEQNIFIKLDIKSCIAILIYLQSDCKDIYNKLNIKV